MSGRLGALPAAAAAAGLPAACRGMQRSPHTTICPPRALPACLPIHRLLPAAASSGRDSIVLLETLKRLMAEQRERAAAGAWAEDGGGHGAAGVLSDGDEQEEEEDLLVGAGCCFPAQGAVQTRGSTNKGQCAMAVLLPCCTG